MEEMFGWSDFGGEKMVGPNCFLSGPTIFQSPNWNENGEEKWFDENDLSIPSPLPKQIHVNLFSSPFFLFFFLGFAMLNFSFSGFFAPDVEPFKKKKKIGFFVS